MKLHLLELEGFGPFRHRQVVDFDAFDDDGIFLIAGRTGAGKSSILDGVCFALYGMVPRYEGAGKRLRSDYSAPDEITEVVLEFTAHDRRYRVARSPAYERPKARGDGFTEEKARVEVSVREAGGWRGLTTSAKEAGTLIADDIVGLTGAQFLQVILLAQNRFAEFLLATNDARQALLRNLFGTRTYGDYQVTLDNRRRESQRQLDKRGDEVEFLLRDAELLISEQGLLNENDDAVAANSRDIPSTLERIASIEFAIQRARYAFGQAEFAQARAAAAYKAAADDHNERQLVLQRQKKRAATRESLRVLEERRDQIADERIRLQRAIDGEGLRAPLEAVASARVNREQCRIAETDAATRWLSVGAPADLEGEKLSERVDEITGQLALWHATRERELELEELRVNSAGVSDALVKDEHVLAAGEQRRAHAQVRLPEIEAELEQLEIDAARLEAAAGRTEALTAQLAAANEVARYAKAAHAADERQAQTAQAHAGAVSRVSVLLRRRLEGAAGQLADALKDDEPCAVCGSLSHPKPATQHVDTVTDDDVEAAQQAALLASEAAQRETEAARKTHADLAAAIARSGGEDPATLTLQLQDATELVAHATAAAARRNVLVAERKQVRSDDDAAAVERSAAAERIATAREALAGFATQIHAIDGAVMAARGGFASVQERILDATVRRDRARDCVATRADTAVADQALMNARRDFNERLAQSPFNDEAEVSAALLSTTARTECDDLIRAFEADLAGQRESLRVLEIDLAGAPEALVDTAKTEAVRVSAEKHRNECAALTTTAATTVERLEGMHVRLESAHSATAGAIAAHQLVAGLADALAGRNVKKMDLETFVLAAELEEIVVAAARRLEEMSGGRYRLRHTDALETRNKASGLGLEVIDGHTGKARSPQSLSGGETFLASLALALGLAEVVTARAGGVKLDTLFIDEGFGSLDSETLELAMATLDELHHGGRTVGIISHVAAMKERITSHLTVETSAHGPSTISHATPGVPITLS
ncbi:AAA family ATPase (plasmid) [Coraliomargarita sp. W4R53]